MLSEDLSKSELVGIAPFLDWPSCCRRKFFSRVFKSKANATKQSGIFACKLVVWENLGAKSVNY